MQACSQFDQSKKLWLQIAQYPNDYASISKMTGVFEQLSIHQLFSLPQNWLLTLTQAARHGFPEPLRAVSTHFFFMHIDQLRKLHPDTLMHVALLSSHGQPQALESMSLTFAYLTVNDLHKLHPQTLYSITHAAFSHYPEALERISNLLLGLCSPDYLINHPDTLYMMAILAQRGNSRPLSIIAPLLRQVSGSQLRNLHPATVEMLALTSESIDFDILDALCPALSQLSLDDLSAMSSGTLVNLSAATSSGHITALNTILPILLTDQPISFINQHHLIINNLVHLAAIHQVYDAIDQCASLLSYIEPNILDHMLALQPQLLKNIVLIAQSGHPQALISLGATFVQFTPDVQKSLDPNQIFRQAYFEHTAYNDRSGCFNLFCKPNTIAPSAIPKSNLPSRKSSFSSITPIESFYKR